jgi:hypothetical protein
MENFRIGLPGSRIGEIVLLVLEKRRNFLGDLDGDLLGLPLRQRGRWSLASTQSTLSVREQSLICPSIALLILIDGTQERAIIETTFSTETFLPLPRHSTGLFPPFRSLFSFKKGRSYIFSISLLSPHSASKGSLLVLDYSPGVMSGKREKLDSESMVAFLSFLTADGKSVVGSILRVNMDLRLPCMIWCLIWSILLMLQGT